MGYFRSSLKSSGGTDYSATYTASVNGVLQKGSCANMFRGNTTLNSPVEIGNNVSSCYYMFHGCSSLNQNIQIPDSIENCMFMFWGCTSLNQNIKIPNIAGGGHGLFFNCASLNQNIQIPSGVHDCYGMFLGCSSLNQNIQIPNGVYNCHNMFYGCPNMSVVYIKGTMYRTIDVRSMFNNGDNAIRKNIHFHSSLNNVFNKTDSSSLVGKEITWTDMTNGFYNSAYNIYCYNNYSG